MKKKLLGILTPVLAGVTLIGTGFSVWYFTDSTSSKKNLNVTVTLADYVSIGSLETETKYDNYELVFDSTEGTGENKGIHLFGSNGESESVIADDIDLTYTYGTSESDGERPTLKLTVTVPGDAEEGPSSLADYLGIELAGSSWAAGPTTDENGDDVYEYSVDTKNLSPDQNGTITIDMPTFVFTFKGGTEPNNVKGWEALNTVLTESNNITFAYELVFGA